MKIKIGHIGKFVYLWIVLATTFFVLYIHYLTYQDIFGENAPYQGMTINMDKFSNPLPILAFIDLGVFLLWVGIYFLFQRKSKNIISAKA